MLRSPFSYLLCVSLGLINWCHINTFSFYSSNNNNSIGKAPRSLKMQRRWWQGRVTRCFFLCCLSLLVTVSSYSSLLTVLPCTFESYVHLPRLDSKYPAVVALICNDFFLVVKVNCPSYVFNISKYIWILRNIKKLGNFRKSARKCAPDDLFTFASDEVIPGKQTREQAIGVLSETLHYTALQ